MRQRPNGRDGINGVLAAAACSMLIASIVTRAQQAPATPAAKPLVPLAASSLLLHPDRYVGQTVAVTGVAERTLSRTAFSLDQGKSMSSSSDVLIVAPTLMSSVPLNTYVTVVGEAVRFDPADVARRLKDYTLDLPLDAIEKYRGQPAVLATAVIDATMTDLAKRPIPPPTAAENAFDQVMKQVSPAFASLRQSVDASATAQVRERTAELKKLFGEAEAFFKTRVTADATAWAADAAKLVDTIDLAAASNRWDEAKTSSASLNQVCQACHAAHRERQDDGTYRIKGSR